MMKIYNSLLVLLLFYCMVSCNTKTNKTARSEITNKEHSFGEITMLDSVLHTFYLKNVSKTPLKITKVGTSCGCTTTNYTEDEIEENETAYIEVLFKPEQVGAIDKSIVVEANTDPPFNVFYLKGEVK